MGYNDVFGGGSINPAQRTYLELTISADIQLQWPIEQQIGGDDVAVDIIDVDATQPGLNVDFSDARQVSTGYTTLFSNIGANTVTIRDAGGGTIISLGSGEAWFIYLTDNSTEAGVWRTFQLGATVSVANASALAGAGLKAISTTLNQTIPPTIIDAGGSPLNMDDADRAQLNIWNAGVGVFNLPDPGTVGSDWFTYIRNDGTGVLTVNTPAGVIDDGGSLMLNPGVSGTFVTDGTDWFTIGLTSSLDTGFDFTEIDVSGSGDFVLSGVQLDRVSYRFIGSLTGDRNIVVPSTIQEYWVDNSTTGAFSLFVNTAGQAVPVEIPVDNRVILYCDGTDVLDAESSSVTFPIAIAQGGTGATTAPGARTNLGVPPLTRLIDTGIGLTGGGDLSSDRTHDLEYVNLSAVAPASGDFITFQDIDDSDAIKKATITDILGSVPIVSAEELIDGSANVRVRAELLGIAQLRSDGNVDAEVRLLEFAHSDGTPRALVGQPTASVNLIMANLMTGGAINLTSGPSSSISLNPEGTLRLVASSLAGQVEVFADGATDTEQHQIVLKDSGGNFKGSFGWTAAEAKMHIANLINGQPIELRADAFGGAPRTLILADPDDDVKLFDAGVEVLRTTPSASGGAEANNLSTGAGFERVLTTSDLGGGGTVYRGCKAYRSSTQNWPLNNTPNFSIPGLGAGADEVAVAFNFNLTDTEALLIHNPAVNNTRFNVPAGITKAIIRAGYSIQGDTSGGYRHMRIRRNGGYLSTGLGQGSFIMHNTNSAAGSGSWWGTAFNTGVLDVNPGDFFEAYVLRQNSSGFTVFSSVWMELEVLL